MLCGVFAAAEGYNKSQGDRLCAVVTTSGPGATNLCTGVASAWRDGVPMIVLTSQVHIGFGVQYYMHH
jgi:acetolactate synthase-1/2/3 large subunit